MSPWPHLDMLVILWYRNELGQPLAQPHSQIPVHVDGERFESLLQAADSEVLQRADILPEVHPAQLTYAQAAHGDEACGQREAIYSHTGAICFMLKWKKVWKMRLHFSTNNNQNFNVISEIILHKMMDFSCFYTKWKSVVQSVGGTHVKMSYSQNTVVTDTTHNSKSTVESLHLL